MKATLTAKLKLHTDPAQFAALRNTQLACSIPRQVGATYKALWTKVKQNNAARKAGLTKKRYKGLDQPPKYVSPTLTYQLGHDYSFKKGQQVSLLSLDGR